MLKIAVIGLGDVANVHLSAIQSHPQAELIAVCDIDPAKESETDATFYTDYEEMLVKETIDCVHICLPHHLHYEITKKCVEHGVHVLLEKPPARDEEETRQLVLLAENHPEVKICICLQNRFNPTFKKLYEAVKSEKYGQLLGVKGILTWHRPKEYYEMKPWRGQMQYAGGGVMINQAIHTLDLMQLLGGKIQSIRGSIDYLSNYQIEVEDTAMAKINFENQATGLFFATNVNSVDSSVELEVSFPDTKFYIKDNILTKVNKEGEKLQIIEDEKMPGSKFYYGASHVTLIHHFYSCIEHDSDDYIHPKDALPAMQIIDAIRHSSQLKQSVLL